MVNGKLTDRGQTWEICISEANQFIAMFNDPGQHNLPHKHQKSWRSGWPRWFGAIKCQSSLLNIYLHLSGSSPRSCLFTSSTGQIGVHTALKYGTKPIGYMTLHFRDQRGAASLILHRNRASTTFIQCVWTEALWSGLVLVPAQKLSGSIVWTPIRYVTLQFRDRRGEASLP